MCDLHVHDSFCRIFLKYGQQKMRQELKQISVDVMFFSAKVREEEA